MTRQLICLSTIAIYLLITGCAVTHSRKVQHHISTLDNSTELKKRRDAAFQLSSFDNVDKKMLPNLIEAFDDNDTIVREFIIKTIGKMDPKINDVTNVLKIGLRDKSLSVRRASAAVFSTLNPVPIALLLPLSESLCDQDSLLSSFTESMFVDLGGIGVNTLVQACNRSDEALRVKAATILGKIGNEAKNALPTLEKLLQDESEQVRIAAKHSISMIQNSNFSEQKKS